MTEKNEYPEYPSPEGKLLLALIVLAAAVGFIIIGGLVAFNYQAGDALMLF